MNKTDSFLIIIVFLSYKLNLQMLKKYSIIIGFLLFLSINLTSQNLFKKVVEEQLPSYLIHTKQEKVYIQTDRDYYQQADTVWFKATLVNAATHSPVKDEKYLYVDLISPDNKVVFHQIYELFNGFTGGYLPIYGNAKPGKYKLISYTNYMKNFSDEFFFSKYIDITGNHLKPINWNISENYINGSTTNDTLRLFLTSGTSDDISSLFDIQLNYNDSISINKTVEINKNGLQLDFFVPKYLSENSPTISINAYQDKTIPPFTKQLLKDKSKIDIQFLPEGGVFIDGIPNKIAFKAIDQSGEPADIRGNIIDEQGNMVANFQTMYNGSGYFMLVPNADKKYMALISSGGLSKPIELPNAQKYGIAMSIASQNKEKIALQLNANLNEEKEFFILGHTRGLPYFAKQGKIKKQQGIIEVDKSLFPSGICTFTLFTDGIPTAERLVYIEHQDQLNLQVSFNKDQYKPGEKVILNIKATNNNGKPAIGSFAISSSEVPNHKKEETHYNISNYFLLSSDLNGALPKNTDYIDSKNPNRLLYTDLLLMTNGWRRFNWDSVLCDTLPQLKYIKENQMYLKGLVTKKSDKKPAPDKTEIIAQLKGNDGFFIENTNTNKQGEYKIKLPNFYGELKLDLLTRTKGGRAKDYNLTMESNVDGFKYNIRAFNKISGKSNVKLNYLSSFSQVPSFEPDSFVLSPQVREDNYYFPGPDIIEIKQVDVKSNYLNLRDSLFKKSGTPDVVIESAQLEAIAKESSWYSNIWDLLADRIPGLDISQGMYTRGEIQRLKRHSNLIIYDRDTSNTDRDMPIYATVFNVHENPESVLIITVDGVFLEGMKVFPYEFLETMNPGEIKSINFLANPQNTDLRWLNMDVMGINEDILMQLEESPGVTADASDGSQIIGERIRKYSVSYLFITTKSGKGPFYTPPVGAIASTLKGLSVYKEFYTPKYNYVDESAESNFKKTLFWDANVITDSLGEANVSFNTNGLKDNVFVNIQGVSINGKTGAYIEKLPLALSSKNQTEKKVHNKVELSDQDYPEYILHGKIVDAQNNQEIAMAKISQNSPYKSTLSNNNGKFLIDSEEFNNEKLTVSGYGYQPTEIAKSDLDKENCVIYLNPVSTNYASIDELPISIVKKAIRKTQPLYSNTQPYKGFSREAMLIDGNTYNIEEMAFNYITGKTVSLKSNQKLEVTSFRILKDVDGNPMPTINPNHLEPTYPVSMDVMTNTPAFLNFDLIKEFNWKLRGSESYNNTDCYVITFDQKAEIYHSREKGIIYIDKSNYGIKHISWEKSPLGIKFLSNVEFLNNTPRHDIKPIKVKYEVNYDLIDDKLVMNSGKKFITFIADGKHLVDFETETVITQKSDKSFEETKTKTIEDFILDEKARSFLTKKPSYSYDPWRFKGIIPLPEKYLKDIKFLHESMIYY